MNYVELPHNKKLNLLNEHDALEYLKKNPRSEDGPGFLNDEIEDEDARP